MKTTLRYSILCLGITLGFARMALAVVQPPDFIWARQAGGPQPNYSWPSTLKDDLVTAMVVDAQGNAYLAGRFVGSVSFGTTTISSTDTNNSDIFLAKYDPEGVLLWARQAGSAASDEAAGLALDGNGEFTWPASWET